MAFAVCRPVPRFFSFPSSSSAKCGIRMAVRKSEAVEKLVSHATYGGVSPELARKVIEQAASAVREWRFGWTNFLTPPESATLTAVLRSIPELTVNAWGGYEDAERTILLLAHEEICSSESIMDMAKEDTVMSCLKISGDFATNKVSHRDLMGAILACGITREKVGDIHLSGDIGQALVLSDISDVLGSSIIQVKNVNVSTSVFDVAKFEEPERRIKEITCVESSMRIDAVASTAFKISRTKMNEMSKSGRVRINYSEVKHGAKTVKVGDTVSVRGLGKLKIVNCETTAKGRYRFTLNKYI